MSKEREAYIDAMRELAREGGPTEEDVKVVNTTEKFYINLRNGIVYKCVTKAMKLYTQNVLPELSTQQVIELTHNVHSLIQTVLTFLVEDGLIKEE